MVSFSVGIDNETHVFIADLCWSFTCRRRFWYSYRTYGSRRSYYRACIQLQSSAPERFKMTKILPSWIDEARDPKKNSENSWNNSQSYLTQSLLHAILKLQLSRLNRWWAILRRSVISGLERIELWEDAQKVIVSSTLVSYLGVRQGFSRSVLLTKSKRNPEDGFILGIYTALKSKYFQWDLIILIRVLLVQ